MGREADLRAEYILWSFLEERLEPPLTTLVKFEDCMPLRLPVRATRDYVKDLAWMPNHIGLRSHVLPISIPGIRAFFESGDYPNS